MQQQYRIFCLKQDWHDWYLVCTLMVIHVLHQVQKEKDRIHLYLTLVVVKGLLYLMVILHFN